MCGFGCFKLWHLSDLADYTVDIQLYFQFQYLFDGDIC